MPLRIDVKANNELLERLHIARMNESGGTSPDAVNAYSVIRGTKDLVLRDEPPFDKREFPEDVAWVDWLDADAEFTHRYGDGAIVLLMKALMKLAPELVADAITVDPSAIAEENVELRKRVAELEAALAAPPF